MILLANMVCIVLSVLATSGAFVIGHGVGYRKGRRRAVANAELGIADGLDRTELPRPGAPAAVVRDADLARGQMQASREWDNRW